MKARESGMPGEVVWRTFFHPAEALSALELNPTTRLAVEFGSGYGTFSLEAARMIRGTVLGFDIESDLVDLCRRRAAEAALSNAKFEVRDFLTEGTGLADEEAGYVMLFNILHTENPQTLLGEAARILAPGGALAIMHWNYDPETPRGPSMDIRPRPDDCHRWVKKAGFLKIGPLIHLPPWHYGFTAKTNKKKRATVNFHLAKSRFSSQELRLSCIEKLNSL